MVTKALEELLEAGTIHEWEHDIESYTYTLTIHRLDSHDTQATITYRDITKLHTKQDIKDFAVYLLIGLMPDIEKDPIGRKLNTLYASLQTLQTAKYAYQDTSTQDIGVHQALLFVDKMRHYMRYTLCPYKYKYTKEELTKVAFYLPNETNLRKCNEFWKITKISQD